MKGATACKEMRFDNASVMEDGVLAPVNGITSKKAKKLTLEKQLEDINKELQSKSSSVNCWKLGLGGSGAKKQQRMKPEQEIVLLEQKCILLLKLKRYKDVLEDGYSILGRMGPITVIYKCILIALVKLGKVSLENYLLINYYPTFTGSSFCNINFFVTDRRRYCRSVKCLEKSHSKVSAFVRNEKEV